MWEWLNATLLKFETNFSRKAAFHWFVVIIIGLMIRNDHLGVTSIVRGLNLDARLYETMLHFFRASSWKIKDIQTAWIHIIKRANVLHCENQMPIIVGDGVKQSKEARKMPGVKKHHQESENSSKAEYIFGHLFGITGVLIGSHAKTFCIPVIATIQDGVNTIRKWENHEHKDTTHVVQIIRDACNVASKLGHSILLVDRYFLSVPALKEWIACEKQFTESLLSIVTKAKKSVVAYESPVQNGGRGRPKVKGEKIKLQELFKCLSNFKEATLTMYGKDETVQYLCKDLLWGKELYHKLRFVLVKYGDTESILVCTDLSFSPERIIQLYGYRFKIEVSFRALKQTLAGFSYHFWTSAMPKLNKYLKKDAPDSLAGVKDEKSIEKILSALKAIEGFVLCSCIALGLLQMIAIRFPNEILASNFYWLRTKTTACPSEATVVDFMRKTIFSMFHKSTLLPILHLIKSKQLESLNSSDSFIA